MNALLFLAAWALRSAVLILCGGAMLRLLKIDNASVRLTAWTAVLCGSLAIPLLTLALPQIPFAVHWTPVPIRQAAAPVAEGPVAVYDTAPAQMQPQSRRLIKVARFDWPGAALAFYFLVALALLLRFAAGLVMSLRLLRRSQRTDLIAGGLSIRESNRLAGPVTLGIVRPVIVLPDGWRGWDNTKRDAVLAHELSHIRRYDPAVQTLSMIHRALLWFSPLSWLLHRRVVRLAEEASDDDAIAATHDRAVYARVLLEFMQPAAQVGSWLGVPLARYGSPAQRIHRILNSKTLSGGIPGWGTAAVFALAIPVAFAAALARPTFAAQAGAQSTNAPQAVPRTPTVPPPPSTPPPTQAAQAAAAPAPPGPQLAALSIKYADPANEMADLGARVEYADGTPACFASNSTHLGYDPGRIRGKYITLRRLVLDAYGLQQHQLVGGPDWLDSACFELQATSDGPADYDAMMVMLRTALADRFGLKLRLDHPAMAVRELRIAPGGIKFKPLLPGETPPPGAQTDGNHTWYGFTIISRLVERISGAGLLAIRGNRDGATDVPAVDATGLTGQFNIVIDHVKSYDIAFTDPVLSQELKDQLGLELVTAQRPQPVYTVLAAHLPDVNQ